MIIKNLLRIVLTFALVFGFSSAWAKSIKWSMAGDSLTLDPHAQNEGPTTQVSRQVCSVFMVSPKWSVDLVIR